MLSNAWAFILADYDGVAVIPTAIKGEVHKKAMEKLSGENVVRDELAAGQSPREVLIATGYCDCWTLIDDCIIFLNQHTRGASCCD